MKYLLGIDIGTGSTKAVAVNNDFQPIGSTQKYYPTQNPHPGFSEQDPAQIWEAFKLCIQEILPARGQLPEAISLSSAMHSLILVDQAGEALAPMMTWSDTRSTAIAKKLHQSDLGMAIYQATGTPIHPMSPLCKIIWLKENEPELFRKAHKFISIKEYIWFKLFGEFKIDHSIASCTGLFDIHEWCWNAEALALAGIESGRLSEPVPTGYIQTLTPEASSLSLSGNVDFVIGASDGCLANLGTEANRPGVAAITIGTSGAIRIGSPKPIYNPSAMTFSYLLDTETYICGGPINNGGVALQWLIKSVFGKTTLETADYTALFKEVEQSQPGSNGLLFLPYLSGERAPIWDSESCGTYFGITLQHQQKDFARATLEGICYALNDVLKAVEAFSEEITQINVSGGFVHSRIWMQILADITGKRVVLIQEEDASAIGAAYLAFKALGLTTGYPSKPATEAEVIEPSTENHLLYRRNFLLFKQLYANLKQTMHQLYHLNH